jgi:hypothetical protein
LVGKISTTFTPSMTDPSVAKDPLTTARRLEASSFQTIPEIFSGGGFAAELPATGSPGFEAFPGGTFVSREVSFGISFLSPGGIAGGLLSVLTGIFDASGCAPL